MAARRTGALAAALTAAGALVVVLLVTWAASIGPSEVLRGDGWQPRATERAEPTISASEPSPPDEREEEDEEPPYNDGLLHVIALVLNVAAVALGIVLVVRLLTWGQRARRARRTRLARRAELGTAEFEVIETDEAVARALLSGAEEQRALLEEGTPRNAVVACWQRFEQVGADAGLARREWETPSEYAIRVLDVVAADSGAVGRLAELYREARFSTHELTEEHRAAAREALARVHQSIRLPAGERPGAGR